MGNILLLFLFISLVQLVPLGNFWFFGSQGDWLSQHVAMGETIRQRMLETGSLIPQYLHLGAGSSGYDAAYYGVLRPDILLSCLFPQVESYPELRAHAAIADAMQQNSYLQREITAARTVYNSRVTQWNTDIFSWPTKMIVAARQGYTTRIPFTASAETRKAAREKFF